MRYCISLKSPVSIRPTRTEPTITTQRTTNVLLSTFLRSGQTTRLNSFFRSLNQPAIRAKSFFFSFFSLMPDCLESAFAAAFFAFFQQLSARRFFPYQPLRFEPPLLCFSVQRMFSAELAVFVHFNPLRIVPLVLLCNIVAALAFCTSQCYFHSHDRHLLLVYFFCLLNPAYPAPAGSRIICLPHHTWKLSCMHSKCTQKNNPHMKR